MKKPDIIGPKAAISNQAVIMKNCKYGFISSLARAAMKTGYDVQAMKTDRNEA